MTINEKAYAKLNISLDVGRRREDGYHDMVMIMQTVSLADDIRIDINGSGEISALSNLPFIPCDERNLAVKAARLWFEAAGRTEGAAISLNKRIPVGAGMAGGSTDAAAVLRGLNRAFDSPLSKEELLDLASKTGSDVAFCLCGGTMLAKGKGEVLTRLRDLPDCTVAICKPRFSVSTPELFTKLDSRPGRHHPDTAGILSSLEEGDLRGICRRMYNVFEDVGDRRMKVVAEIKSKLIDAGALGAIMTGTGSAVFGIFSDEADAEEVIAPLRKEYGFATTTRPVGKLL